jgi:hypothetical protein
MKAKNFENLMQLLTANALYSALSKPGTSPIIVACNQKSSRRVSLWLENNGINFHCYTGIDNHSYNKHYESDCVFQLMSTDCLIENGFSAGIQRIESLLITNDKNAYPFKKDFSVATELEYLVFENLKKDFNLTKIQDIWLLQSRQDRLHKEKPYGFKYVLEGLLENLSNKFLHH